MRRFLVCGYLLLAVVFVAGGCDRAGEDMDGEGARRGEAGVEKADAPAATPKRDRAAAEKGDALPGKQRDEGTGGGAAEEAPPAGMKNSFLHSSTSAVPGVGHSAGAQHREDVRRARKLVHSGVLEEAETLVEKTLNAFYSDMEKAGKLYVSVANKKELAAFKKEHPNAEAVWLDYAFGEALHLHSYIAVERRNFQEALRRSEKEMEFRPYAADTWTERGIILNHLHRPKEALKAYQRARQVAERFASNSDQRAVVLRGIGFTQVELGNLEAARAAIEASLELAPENKLGLRELEYIKRRQKRQKRRERGGSETE